MTMFVFVVSVMVNGVLNVATMQFDAVSDSCVHERQVVAAMNRANMAQGVDVRYFGECRVQ